MRISVCVLSDSQCKVTIITGACFHGTRSAIGDSFHCTTSDQNTLENVCFKCVCVYDGGGFVFVYNLKYDTEVQTEMFYVLAFLIDCVSKQP